MKFIAILILLLFPVTFTYAPPVSATSIMQANSAKYSGNVAKAASYLVNQFNSSVGLVSESPDKGVHWMKRVEQPSWHWFYNQTFWLYSDNLFAEYALLPWRPDISAQVNATYQRYNPPFSNKFESVMGIPVGPDRAATDVIVNSSTNFVVLYRIHDGTFADPNIPFADAIIYRALSEHYLGQQDLAVKDVNWAASLFNGTCVVDYGVTQTELTPSNAPSDIRFCTVAKVAAIMYGAQVVGVQLPQFAQMEEYLWSAQQANGGLTTLYQNGKFTGSANTESTAFALLNYNQALIERLRNNVNPIPEYPSIQILILTATLITIISIILFRKMRNREL